MPTCHCKSHACKTTLTLERYPLVYALTYKPASASFFFQQNAGIQNESTWIWDLYVKTVSFALQHHVDHLYVCLAGALLAVGITNCGVQDECDPAYALLCESVNHADDNVRIGAIMGLGLAYAGTQKAEVQVSCALTHHSFAHSLTYSLTHALTHPLTRPPTDSRIHTYSSSHSLPLSGSSHSLSTHSPHRVHTGDMQFCVHANSQMHPQLHQHMVIDTVNMLVCLNTMWRM